MAERVSQVAVPAPVAQLVQAWNERSADRFAAALTDDVQVAVPPLHLELRGREEVWDGVSHLFAAFGALRYTSRHRYLSPDGVTDEVMLEGLQTRDFLGAPPSGRPGAVAARVMMRHDGRQVTSLTVWPDVSALRELSGSVASIDLRAAGSAASAVAALRATIPSSAAKVSIGHDRQLSELLPPEDATLLPGAPVEPPTPEPGQGGRGKSAKKAPGPKAPMPRKARRRRAVAAGILMLGLAGALGTYVVQGVKGARDPAASATSKPTPSAQPTTAPSPKVSPSIAVKPSASPTPSSSRTFDQKTNTYTFNNAILFELNQFQLRRGAKSELQQVVAELIKQQRYGRIAVTGYTDDTGTPAVNQRLSEKRAQVVKVYLRSQLKEQIDGAGQPQLLDKFTVVSSGKGEADPAVKNDSEANRAQNRRVQVQVPEQSRSR